MKFGKDLNSGCFANSFLKERIKTYRESANIPIWMISSSCCKQERIDGLNFIFFSSATILK